MYVCMLDTLAAVELNRSI